MSEAPRARRRDRSQAANRGARLPKPLPRLINPWKPLEAVSAEALERIIDGGFRILAEAGLEIMSARARDFCRRAGAAVDDASQLVRMERGLVEELLAKAPREFVLHARNPSRHLHAGGATVNFGPVVGAPHITDLERGRRAGDFQAFCDLIKLNHALGAMHWSGGVVVEPADLPVPVRHLHMCHGHILYADIPWAARSIGRVAVDDAVRMAAIEHGLSLDDLARRPSVLAVTNTNSPRRVDEELLDGMLAMAEYGQAVCITPFTLAGAMAPITLAGALAQQTAEAMGIIALLQMVRPGAPAVFGGFTSNVDMRTGGPAFGTPEYVRATIAGGQIARRLGLPYRSSGVCSSTSADAQAAYETGFSLFAAIMSHANFIQHSAGWLEGGLSASFEKTVIDCEMLHMWAASMQPIEAGPDDLALDTIMSVPPGGHFFGTAHTMTRFETAFHQPIVSDWRTFEAWRDSGSETAAERALGIWKKTLADYQPPPLDASVADELKEYVERREREILAAV